MPRRYITSVGSCERCCGDVCEKRDAFMAKQELRVCGAIVWFAATCIKVTV